MVYSQNALFNIKIQGGNKTFNHRFSQFGEILNDFANSNILEYLPELEKLSNTSFFEQLKLYQNFIKNDQFESLTPSIKTDKEYWENVIGYAECSNPYEVFIIAQLAHFISKKVELGPIIFGVGYEGKFTRIICLINGEIEWVDEQIIDDELQEEEDSFQMNLGELRELFDFFKDSIVSNNEYELNVEDIKQSEVMIGNQIWMSKNLNVERFRNGDLIPHIKSDEEWEEAGKNGQPAWCYYDNNPQNGEIYGKIYNSHAVNDPRGLAPEGWYIPDYEEWTDLIIFLGGDDDAGGKLKSKTYWNSPNYGDINKSGFSALPGGFRTDEGKFYNLNEGALYCCVQEPDDDDDDDDYDEDDDNNKNKVQSGIYFELSNRKSEVTPILFYPQSFGGYVRCLDINSKTSLDEEYEDVEDEEYEYEDMEDEEYGEIEDVNLEVRIGYNIWMIRNLDVDCFRNGDLIPHIESAEEWEEAGNKGQPAWCYYDNDPKNGEIYGKLYNWHAVNDPRGLAPKGWHIPHDEWERISYSLGHQKIGGKMKSKTYWKSPNKGATNSSGFSALPGGIRNEESEFVWLGENAIFWRSKDENYVGSDQATIYCLWNDDTCFLHNIEEKSCGLSVRCVKD